MNSDSKETKCPSKSYNGASLVACAYVRRAKQFKKDKPEPINVNAMVCVRCHFDEELVAARRRDGVSFLLHTSVKLSKSYLAVAATLIHNVTYVRTYTQYTCLNVRGRWSSSIATLYFFPVCAFTTRMCINSTIFSRDMEPDSKALKTNSDLTKTFLNLYIN